jgi:hypothetical protein
MIIKVSNVSINPLDYGGMVPTACRHEFIALLPRSSLRSLLEEFANFALTRELVKIFITVQTPVLLNFLLTLCS